MGVKFTTTRVMKFEPPTDKAQVFHWDEDSPLGVRVTKKGHRAYVFQGRLGDSTPRMTIGDVSVWPLDDARKEARRLQQLCDQGIDPRREKKENKDKNAAFIEGEKNAKLTFGTTFNEYIEANKERWSDSHYKNHLEMIQPGGEKKIRNPGLTIPGVMASLLNVALVDINTDLLIQWQNTEASQRPARAALGFRLIRTFINWCAEDDRYSKLISPDVHKRKKLRKAVPNVKARKNSVMREQLKDWFAAVQSIDNPVISVFIQSLIINGPRFNAMVDMRYDMIDFKWDTWQMWDKDDQDYHVLPLTPYVKKLILSLPRKNEYVFYSSRAKSGHIVNPYKAYYESLARQSLPRFSPHDLRRSFSSLTEWLSVPEGVSAQIQGHKPSATREKHYKDRSVDLLRMHHLKIEKWILEQAGIDTTGLYPESETGY